LQHDHDRSAACAPTVRIESIALPAREDAVRRGQEVLNAEPALGEVCVESCDVIVVSQVQVDPHRQPTT